MAREVFDSSPDEVALFNARVSGWSTRDAGGLPLGDVSGHALNRLTQCYAIIESAKLAGDFGAIAGHQDFMVAGASVQDWRGTRDYPAAHLAPCTLKIGTPGSSSAPKPLYQSFEDGINRSFVANLFAKTEPVHRLVNYADSLCERQKGGTGMGEILAQACRTVAKDPKANPREVLHDELIPIFQMVANERITLMRQTIPEDYRPSPLLNQFGRPYYQRPEDVRVHSPSPEAYKANRAAVLQVLSLYAGAHNPRLDALAKVADQFKALRANEQRARTKTRG